jgi:hypothetical protein
MPGGVGGVASRGVPLSRSILVRVTLPELRYNTLERSTFIVVKYRKPAFRDVSSRNIEEVVEALARSLRALLPQNRVGMRVTRG